MKFTSSNPGSILYENGAVKIYGTNHDDTANVFFAGPSYRGTSKVAVTLENSEGSQTKVFNLYPHQKIEFFGYSGADTFNNYTYQPSYAEGGAGTDKLNGGSGVDKFYGGDGNDVLIGRGGNDVLAGNDGVDILHGKNGDDTISGGIGDDWIFGEEGLDKLYGDGGNDTIYGGLGDDFIYGASGNDSIFGAEGVDTINGGYGDDRIYGGAEGDTIYGMQDDDLLKGGGGDDKLYGNSGNDDLYGDDDNDTLNGGSGRDGLFGGYGLDGLTGGTGPDRFLIMGPEDGITDTASDVYSGDVVLRFLSGSDPATRDYWTDKEVISIDKALRVLHDRTNNTELLKTSSGDNIIFERIDSVPGSAATAGINTGQIIQFTDRAFGSDAAVHHVTFHEIGHNWDSPSENSVVSEFRSLNGWTQDPPDTGFWWVEANDGWYYSAFAGDFASDYAKNSPYEDFAESFAATLLEEIGMPFTFTQNAVGADAIPDKVDLISNWIDVV